MATWQVSERVCHNTEQGIWGNVNVSWAQRGISKDNSGLHALCMSLIISNLKEIASQRVHNSLGVIVHSSFYITLIMNW